MMEFNIDDNKYWNDFYREKHTHISSNTLFAEYIFNHWVHKRKTILECGCGNGRDSLYFGKKGLSVVGVDASKTAINHIKNDVSNCKFICGDFINSKYIYEKSYDICYSRFTIHAICLEQELALINNVYKNLNSNGLFCIEVRSIHDELYGKGKQVGKDSFIYNNHYRRFIRMEDLLVRLMDVGFRIRYAEENTGFAPFEDADPQIIRIVACKQKDIE